jgi:hypothetical protein
MQRLLPPQSTQDIESRKDIAATGIRVAGSVGGGILGGMAGGPFGVPAGATIGEEFVKQAINQPLGLEPESGFLEDLTDFAGRGALNYALPGTGSVRQMVKSFKGIPATETAKKAAQIARTKGIVMMDEDVIDAATRFSREMDRPLTNVQTYASDPRRAIAAELSAHGGESLYERAIAKQFDDNVDTLINSGVFNAPKSVEELKILARANRVAVGEARANAVKQATDAIASVEKKFGEHLPQLAYIDDIEPLIAPIRARIAKLSQNDLSSPIAESLEKTINGIVRDVGSSGGATPRQLLDFIENLNEVRRTLLQEFSRANVGRASMGDTKAIVAANGESSIEAISAAQEGLKKILASKLDLIAKSHQLPISGQQFLSDTKQYGAFKALEDISEKFLTATERGLVSEPRRMTGIDPRLTGS